MKAPFAIVTATLNPAAAHDCFASWVGRAGFDLPVYVVWSSLDGEAPLVRASTFAAFPRLTLLCRDGGGVVPAFNDGVQQAARDGHQAILCLHSDLLIEEDGWDRKVVHALDHGVKFAGFGGATGLGADDLYLTPYDPMQLARRDFVSNLREAEAHGRRSTQPEPCVCFDGFSQLGTVDWFPAAWQELVRLGVRHHLYDSLLGCLAARAGVQPGWMLPVGCHHAGGVEAVGNRDYHVWAGQQIEGGDAGFWQEAHRIGWEAFRDVLPLRLTVTAS